MVLMQEKYILANKKTLKTKTMENFKEMISKMSIERLDYLDKILVVDSFENRINKLLIKNEYIFRKIAAL